MHPHNHNSEAENNLDLAARLQAELKLTSQEANAESWSVPDDFNLALKGLDLVCAAATADRNSSPTTEPDSPSADSSRSLESDHISTNRLQETQQAQDTNPIVGSDAVEHVGAPVSLPRQIGRFEILRELGRGGFGIVLLGRDQELNRKVAIKIPRLEMLLDDQSLQRFNREAYLASTLSHPAIVPVFEYSANYQIPFIAFAWCRGCSLTEWIKQLGQPVTPKLAAQIVQHLAGAIQYAHQRGVVHRDLKPSNVLLDIDVDNDVDQNISTLSPEVLLSSLRITDFGLAKSLWDDGPSLTRNGAMIGTPNYMAPEQFTGKDTLTPAVDIYALGAILYELLTGGPPFLRDSDLETMRAVEQCEPIRPRKGRPNISRDLESIVLCCLAKSPSHRYSSAFALQEDLERVIAEKPVVVRRISSWERALRWCYRNPTIAMLASTTSLAILIATATALIGWQATSQALNREMVAKRHAESAFQEAKSAVDQYYVTVSENQLLSTPGLKPLRQQLMQSAIEYYTGFIARHAQNKDLSDDLAKAYVRRAAIDDELGDFPAARQGYDQASELFHSKLQRSPDDKETKQQIGMILRKQARLDRQLGNRSAALDKIEQAIAIHQALIDAEFNIAINHGELGQLLSNHANLFVLSGELDKALSLHERSEEHFLDACLREPGNPKFEHWAITSNGNQGLIALQRGDAETASKRLIETNFMLLKLVGQHPEQLQFQLDLGKSLANLSTTELALGQPERALDSLQSATVWFDKLSMIHPQVASYQALRCSTRRNIALILNNLNRLTDSESKLLEVKTIVAEMSPSWANHQDIRQESTLTNLALGRLYQQTDREELALDHLGLALSELDNDYNRNPGNLVTGQALVEALQQMALVTEDSNTAENHLDRSLAVLDELQSSRPNNPNLAAMREITEQIRKNLGNRSPVASQK